MAKLTEIVNLKADITYVDTSLNSKVEITQVLTDVPVDAVFTDTVYDNTSVVANTTAIDIINSDDTVEGSIDTKISVKADIANIYTKIEIDNKLVILSGDTASRPSENLTVGQFYFDTEIAQPIWLKTIAETNIWVNGVGDAK